MTTISNGRKPWTSSEVFQAGWEQCFLRLTPFGVYFGLSQHKIGYNIVKQWGENKKYNMGSFCLSFLFFKQLEIQSSNQFDDENKFVST